MRNREEIIKEVKDSVVDPAYSGTAQTILLTAILEVVLDIRDLQTQKNI